MVSWRWKPEVAMNFDLEEDFENERWSLLALVDARKSLREGSESAITTDLMILAARELIRRYETLKGYWSRMPPPRRQRRASRVQLECSEAARHPEAAVPLLQSLEISCSGILSDPNKTP
jgi:hypothetical protein